MTRGLLIRQNLKSQFKNSTQKVSMETQNCSVYFERNEQNKRDSCEKRKRVNNEKTNNSDEPNAF